MATNDSSSWMMQRLVTWRTWSLAGAVLASTLILNMLVLGAAPTLEIGSADPPATTAPPVPTAPPSTVVLGFGAPNGPRPIPTVVSSEPPVDPATVAEEATPTREQNVVAQPAPAVPTPVVVPVTTAKPAPATTQPPTTQPPTTQPPMTQPPTTQPPTTQPPTTQPPTTQPPTTAAPTTAAPTVQYLTYSAPSGAGDIVIAFTGTEISLAGFYPNAGWVSQTERNGPRTVKLKFFNTETERDREWKAELEGGRIEVEN